MRNYDFECVATQINCGPGTREYIEREWDKAVNRIENWIKTVRICITDINGPKGGINQRCRIVMQTRLGAPIVVQETRERLSSAINVAIRRSVHTLKRKISKKRDQKKQPVHIETQQDAEGLS
ncbi:hypothetical protein F1728_25360 [Gimesia benthica]|uniref:HPF/RaiA family ribosome-associated protein n=1 Tax=Gimesia benthica TaxID=2608982 RepID=A0A6I6AHC4_9PLAN|nr:hypothetical protein [Gimesia benthica]QGQ25797.1 hypothetical protein F1728_25360 [Gimesia benthica]